MSRRKIAVSSAFLAGHSLLLNAISLFATAYIIRRLGAVAYGEWATAAALTAVNGAVASFGLRPLFVRALAQRSKPARQLLSEQFGVRLLLGFAASIASVGCAFLLEYPPDVINCAIVSAVSLILTVIWTVFADYLQANERFTTYSIVSFIAGIVLTAFSVVAAWAGGGAVALAWAYVSGPLFTVLALGGLLYQRGELAFPRISIVSARHLLRDSRSIAASQLLGILRDRGEQLLVPKAVGIRPFGYYAGSVMPADRLNILPDAIATAFYPRLAGTKSTEIASQSAIRLVTIVTLITGAAAALLYIVAPVIAYVLYPSAADTSLEIIRISCLGIPAAGLSTAFTYSLQATGEHRAVGRRTAWLNTVAFGVMAFCIWRWGLRGAALAWVLKHVVMVTGLAPQFTHQFRLLHVKMAKTSLVLAAVVAITWLVKGNDTELFKTALRAFAAVVALAPVMWLFARDPDAKSGNSATRP
jgi:O-antigen/teichoic acid export membrane protein